MADIDRLLAQLWVAAVSKGPEWLQSQLAPSFLSRHQGRQQGPRTFHAQRSWPLERFSPRTLPRALRHSRSPQDQDLSGFPAKRQLVLAGPGPRRNPHHWRSSVGARLRGVHTHHPRPCGGVSIDGRTPLCWMSQPGGGPCEGGELPRPPGPLWRPKTSASHHWAARAKWCCPQGHARCGQCTRHTRGTTRGGANARRRGQQRQVSMVSRPVSPVVSDPEVQEPSDARSEGELSM